MVRRFLGLQGCFGNNIRRIFADENRSALLESGFPQTVVSVLEGYAEAVEPTNLAPLPLSIPDLRIVKTSIGVLLNLSVGFGKYRAFEYGVSFDNGL